MKKITFENNIMLYPTDYNIIQCKISIDKSKRVNLLIQIKNMDAIVKQFPSKQDAIEFIASEINDSVECTFVSKAKRCFIFKSIHTSNRFTELEKPIDTMNKSGFSDLGLKRSEPKMEAVKVQLADLAKAPKSEQFVSFSSCGLKRKSAN